MGFSVRRRNPPQAIEGKSIREVRVDVSKSKRWSRGSYHLNVVCNLKDATGKNMHLEYLACLRRKGLASH